MYALRTWQILFILATLAMPALGQAVDAANIDIDNFDTGVFAPVNGDQSVNVLRYLFGEIIDSLMFGIGFGGGDGGFLADMFRVFNVVILFFGAIIFVYTCVVGIASTAHEGEVLGRRWSSMWVPIRVVIGFGSLLPVASGYSLIQVIVLWATLGGIGLAVGGALARRPRGKPSVCAVCMIRWRPRIWLPSIS